jgi:hypothetical protein
MRRREFIAGLGGAAAADKRTRSKWSRVMRYAAVYKLDSSALDHFIRRKGGINACAGRFTRRLGRASTTDPRCSARGVKMIRP